MKSAKTCLFKCNLSEWDKLYRSQVAFSIVGTYLSASYEACKVVNGIYHNTFLKWRGWKNVRHIDKNSLIDAMNDRRDVLHGHILINGGLSLSQEKYTVYNICILSADIIHIALWIANQSNSYDTSAYRDKEELPQVGAIMASGESGHIPPFY